MSFNLKISIREKKKKLDSLRPFPKLALEKLRQQMAIEWTFNSNAIEGNTLSLKETALILNEGLTISGKPLREHFEATNHKEAIQTLEKYTQDHHELNDELVCSLHRLILKNIDEEEAGHYRRHSVRILGATHIPPNPLKVTSLMNTLFEWFQLNQKKMDPLELAARLHHQFVSIHPFIDGNGRTARLLMNFVLMRKGYPPAVILKVDRRKYYRVLQEADQGKNEDYFHFIARSIERSLIIYLQALTPPKQTDERQGYITLAHAAQKTPYSQEYLSLLARRGILPSVKFGRNWMTTLDAIRDYSKKHNKVT
ncbi:MAG: Fic family protein [Elusimicrobiota bacterium]